MSEGTPSPDAHQQALLRYRKSLVLVAVISVLCGIVIGVYAIAPYRTIEETRSLTPPALHTAVPLADLPLVTTVVEATPIPGILEATATEQTTRSTGIEVEIDDTDGLLNINTATAEQLQALPGIGATRAQDIIAYRETHEDFVAIEDITLVSGIGEGTLAKIAPYITVDKTQD